MIIDCHGHYTTAPDALGRYRERQKAELRNDPLHRHVKGGLDVTDDQIRESLEGAQLRLQRERGTDPDHLLAARELDGPPPRQRIHQHRLDRALQRPHPPDHQALPPNFAGVAQLPQTPGAPPTACIASWNAASTSSASSACNLNPDPSGGYWTDPPARRPLVVSLLREDGGARRARDDHVSAAATPPSTPPAPLPRADTTAVMQMITSDLSGTSRPSGSSFRTAAAPSPTTGAASGGSPT